MGRVWLARDTSLGRQIALKELRPDQADNPVVCSRFLHEARITAQLEDPGIVPVYEVGEGEAPYYTMRFVQGRTLSKAIWSYHKQRAAGPANPIELVKLLNAFVSVCHAVAYAHSRGIIHRDLKGQNVVLGDFGEVMVLDWGLAKRIDPGPNPDGGEGEASTIAPDVIARARGAACLVDNTAPLQNDMPGGSLLQSGSIPSANGSSSRAADWPSRSRQPIRVESGAGPRELCRGNF